MENQNEKKKLFLVSKINIKDSPLANRKNSDWVEESFINYSQDDISRGNKNYFGLFLSGRALNWCLFLIWAAVAFLLFRSAYLQILKGEDYFQLAENNRLRVYHIQAPRGIIYDRNNVALVKNVPNFSMYLTPVDFPKDENERQTVLTEIKDVFNEDTSEVYAKILEIKPSRKEYYQPQLLIESLKYDDALKLQIRSVSLPGVNIEINNRRYYLQNSDAVESAYFNSLSHLLGYIGKVSQEEYQEVENQGYLFSDVIGKTGLEKSYETQLRGKFGKKQLEVDSLGKEKKVIAQEEVVKGDNLILTIDLEAQNKLEELLRQAILKNNFKSAVGIVQNPQNGEIIAMVSLPSYDNNLFAQGIEKDKYQALLDNPEKPLFNRAVSGEYPSGSVIKPIFAAAALQEKIITPRTTFLSTGGIRIDSWFFPDWAAGGHGLTNVYKAISMSVNTFFYIIGGGYNDFKGLGVYKLNEYGQRFGLDKLTKIDLPNEQEGFLPTPEWKQETKKEQWYIGDTYHMAIGQGDVLTTPLQVCNYTSAFANGGILYQPRLVKEIVNSQTGYKREVLPEVLNSNFIDQSNIEIVRQAMRQTVTTGSGRFLNGLPIQVAGKTGTAQFSSAKKTHAWFSGFAPFDEPQVTITILLEEAGEGSEFAVPVAYDFLNWYFGIRNQ
jgi:penicillin-binding protein 2